MKIKRVIAILLTICVFFMTNIGFIGLAIDQDAVTMYGADGRTVAIPSYAVGIYEAAGWYDSYEKATTTVYAMDGRTLRIYKGDLEAYKQVGWYETYEEVTATMYAMDGRTLVVYKNDVEAYKQVGWYETKEEVSVTLYSKDGRTMTVLRKDKDAYNEVGWYDDPRCLDPRLPMVALTFDDGPGAATATILDCLKAYNVRATFFVIGKSVYAYPEMVARAVNEGMEIGSHTYGHPRLTGLSWDGIRSQISRTDNAVSSAAGVTPTLLRPPYGSYNSTVQSAAGKAIIMWSVDTRDWESKNATSVYDHVMSHVKDGDIILMHDVHLSTGTAVWQIVPELINRGYQLVTVSELAYYKGITLENGQVYRYIR